MNYTFEEDHLWVNDSDGSEAKVNYSQVEALYELPEHYLIKLKNALYYMLPKREIEAEDALKQDLLQLADKCGLTLEDYRNWRWK